MKDWYRNLQIKISTNYDKSGWWRLFYLMLSTLFAWVPLFILSSFSLDSYVFVVIAVVWVFATAWAFACLTTKPYNMDW